MNKTIHSSFINLCPTISRATLAILVILSLFFSLPAQAGKTAEAATAAAIPGDLEPVITATVSRMARLTIYNSVVILPIVVNGNKLDESLTNTFYQAILELQKYQLVPLETIVAWFEQRFSPETPFSPTELIPQVGIDFGASGVIVSKIEHQNGSKRLLDAKPREPRTICTFTMMDIRSRNPVWSLSISIREDELGNLTPELDEEILQQAIDVLRTEMIQNGDIFSTELPQPEVLSTQGDIRSVRIVLQPDPPHIFSSYQLLRGESADASFSAVGSPVANKIPLILVDEGLQDAASYYYTVIGLTGEGFANVPAPPFKVDTTGPPAPVNNLHAAGGNLRHIQVFWQPSQDPTVTDYILFRSSNPKGPFEQIAEINGREKQTYIDRGQPSGYSRYGILQDNSRYFYTIRARNVVGIESSDSRVASASTKGAPQEPTNVQAINRQPQKIPLAWTASPDPEVVGYAIYRASGSDGPFQQIDYVNGREKQQYVDDGRWDNPLTNDTTYWYRLRSVNVVEVESVDSSTVEATTKPAPKPVAGVRTVSGLFRQIKLEWQPNPEPDIQAYEVYRGTIENNINIKAGSIEPGLTTYTDTALGDSRTYWYQIRAVDKDGLAGELSELVQATTKHPPGRPTGLKGALIDRKILITWEANPEQDIVNYEVSSGGFLSGILGTPDKPLFLYQQNESPGTELRFQVRAVDSDGLKSEFTDPLSVIIPE